MKVPFTKPLTDRDDQVTWRRCEGQSGHFRSGHEETNRSRVLEAQRQNTMSRESAPATPSGRTLCCWRAETQTIRGQRQGPLQHGVLFRTVCEIVALYCMRAYMHASMYVRIYVRKFVCWYVGMRTCRHVRMCGFTYLCI